MNERHNFSPKNPEHQPPRNEAHSQHEKIKVAHEKALSDGYENRPEQARHTVEQEAISGAEYGQKNSETTQDTPQVFWDKRLKKSAFNKTMNQVRHRLPQKEKQFSKVIHTKSIEAVSEVAERTIARPIGILMGSMITFFGSVIIIILARRGGFEIRFSIFALLFIAGYGIGFVFEICILFFKKLSHRTPH